MGAEDALRSVEQPLLAAHADRPKSPSDADVAALRGALDATGSQLEAALAEHCSAIDRGE